MCKPVLSYRGKALLVLGFAMLMFWSALLGRFVS